ncbi:MAG TPA: hypothetical protein PKI55_06370 [Chitinophagaceae bacterium]|nr:hypothetical protein [Chitinophagaceae bacterium]
MRQNRIVYRGHIWSIVLNDFPKTTREVRRALVETIGVGWPVKWGLKYDIALPEKQMIPTNCGRVSDMMTCQWIVLAIENCPKSILENNTWLNEFLSKHSIESLKQINEMPV